MKSMDEFKSMEELKAFVDSLKDITSPEDYELILFVCGLLENRGDSEAVTIQGKEVKIDKYIAPMIVDLNKRGIKTLACCSGLQVEHPKDRFKPEAGYLALSFDNNLFEFIKQNMNDSMIKIQESRCYFQPAIIITIKTSNDTILKEKWKIIWDTLNSWAERNMQ